jgi:hypothetical protein
MVHDVLVNKDGVPVAGQTLQTNEEQKRPRSRAVCCRWMSDVCHFDC